MARKRQPIALQSQVTGISYDAEGFVSSAQHHLTEQQLEWLSFRMSSASDEEACDITAIDLEIVQSWRGDPEFEDVLVRCLSNKREAFKFLSGQLLPKALRTISSLLDSEKLAAQVHGVTLLLRAQGLLMDKRTVANPDDIKKLVDALRAPMRVEIPSGTVIDVTPVEINGDG